MTMLEIRELRARPGGVPVLHGVDLDVREGEIVALLGRNGSGRSTLLKTLMGLEPGQGQVHWRGVSLLGRPAHEIARLGLGYVPESRDVFPTLTVQQNLALGRLRRPGARPPRWREEDLLSLFPALQARWQVPAGVLSGGEQQMLSLARTVMGDPDLVLVDEPTEGLAPQLVERVADFLRVLRQRGVGVLLVEQKLAIALAVADRCALMGRGRIVFSGTPQALEGSEALRREWLQV